jgi:phosphatidylserine decarboxylase
LSSWTYKILLLFFEPHTIVLTYITRFTQLQPKLGGAIYFNKEIYMEFITNFIPSIHREGYIFIAIFAVVTLFIGTFAFYPGLIGVVLTLWCIYFFRDPERVTPLGDNYIVSPADGVVQMITRAKAPEELEMGDKELTRVSIFLNVFDVHVNRVPASGKIEKLVYHPGKFFNASLDKASKDNERQTVLMKTKDGQDIIFVQIAGLVARRIVCNIEENQDVKAGERFGIIRFGSRMDVYLPDKIEPQVVVGQRAVGGETIIADLKGKHKAMEGEIR